MLHRLSREVRHNLVAWVALFFALTGTGIAASRYIITRKSQIKPSVLRELQPPAIATAAKAAKAAHAVVAKVRSTGTFTSSQAEAEVPVTGASWVQQAGEDELFMGAMTVTSPTRSACDGGGALEIQVDLDGEEIASPSVGAGGTTETIQVAKWEVASHAAGLFEPGHSESHTITVKAYYTCEG